MKTNRLRKLLTAAITAGALAAVALPADAHRGHRDHDRHGARHYQRDHHRHGARQHRRHGARHGPRVTIYAAPFYPRRSYTRVYTAPPREVVRYQAPTVQRRTFIYPRHGQSPREQDRDRYQCHAWAVEQTGYDPSAEAIGGGRTVTYLRRDAGYGHARLNPITGAAGGAALGAVGGAVAGDAGAGAAIGAAVGAATGILHAIIAPPPAYAAERVVTERRVTRVDPGVRSDYRRAIGACLESRGYTVR